MENDSKKTIRFIRHYTDVDALFKILRNGLRFSKPSSNWQDKNDKWALERYQELRRNNKDVFVLCFCDGIGNIHHWDAFGHKGDKWKNKKHKIKCYIKIDKAKFTEYLHSIGYQLVEVEYPILTKIQTDYATNIVEKLPYLKRSEYSVEHELRIVAEFDHNDSSHYLPIRSFVHSITLSMDATSSEYKQIKQELIKEFALSSKQITHSGVYNSPKWQNTIEQLL